MNITASLTFLDFTTKERIKLQMGKPDDVNQDVLIDQLITSVSAQFVRYMGLHANALSTHTEVYELRQHKKVLTLDALNVVTGTLVLKHSSQDLPTADWTTTSAVNSTLYSVSRAGGWLRLNFETSFDPNYFQVEYAGGFGSTTADIIADFPDLALAAEMQVQYLFSRQKRLGGDVTRADGRSTAFGGQYRMLREVEDILDLHRRVAV